MKRNLNQCLELKIHVRIFLFKSEIIISHGTNYEFVSSYTFDLKYQNKDKVSSPVN